MIRKSSPLPALAPLLPVLVLVLLPGALQAQAQGRKVAPEVYKAAEEAGFVRVNVALEARHGHRPPHLPSAPGERRSARKAYLSELKRFHRDSQSRALALIEGLKARGHARDVRALWIANIISLSASAEAISAISRLEEVVGVSPDVPRHVLGPGGEIGPTLDEVAWGVSAIGADRVWSELGVRGSGVLIAMLDTGVDYTHSDLQGRMWSNQGEIPANGIDDDGNGYIDDSLGYDFADADGDPMDDDGHGTITAGIAAGDGTGGTCTGVAPGASIMACKVLTNGMGIESSSWEAVQYAVEHGADVINLSIGWIQCVHNPSRGMWRSVLENAMEAGVVVCAAAGNEGNAMGEAYYCAPPYNIRTPGDVPGVITAGAVRESGEVALFSSRGPVTWQYESPYYDHPYPPGFPKPDLCAPGAKVNSTVLGGGYSGDYWSGTSTATPYVAGAAALMVESAPTAKPEVIKQYMLDHAIPLSESPEMAGHGMLDAYESVSAIRQADLVAPEAITDLAATPGPGPDEVTLHWTAPGDDGTDGAALYYDVRYAAEDAGPIDSQAAWESAEEASGEPAPAEGGSIQAMRIAGLTPGAGYYFAVRAVDDFSNMSGLSNSPHSATGAYFFFAQDQHTEAGVVISGALSDLEESDDAYLILEEQEIKIGKPSRRHDELIHTWEFTVPGGYSDLLFSVEAHHSENSDYEDFIFSFSEDGVEYGALLTVTKTEDDGQAQTAPLPAGLSGTVYIRLEDTGRSEGQRNKNVIYVDRLVLRGGISGDASPPLFAGLVGAVDTGAGGEVDLFWSDAVDLEGSEPITYNVYQATAPGGHDYGLPDCSTGNTCATITGLEDGTAYYFVVRAKDSAGNEDGNCVELSVTPTAPSVTVLFVKDIDVKVRNRDGCWKAGASVAMEAEGGSAGGATVTGEWFLNGRPLSQVSATASDDGLAYLPSPCVPAEPGDVFAFVVQDIVAEGCVYDPSKNIESEDSAVVEEIIERGTLASQVGPGDPVSLSAPRTVGSKSFRFDLTLATKLTLSARIYDASGRLIRRLAEGTAGPGPRRLTWDGSTSSGRRAPPGVYYYRIVAGPLDEKGKLILVR